MKRFLKTLSIVLVSLLLFTCKKQDVSTEQSQMFVKYYGGALGDNHGYDVKQTADGGYIIAGTVKVGDNNTDAVLIKTDAMGNQVWMKNFGSSSNDNDEGKNVQLLPNGGFVMCGTYGGTKTDMLLVIADANGNGSTHQIGYKIYNEVANTIKVNPDGDFLLLGSTVSIASSKKPYMVKVKPDGSVRWSFTQYGSSSGSGDDVGNCLTISSDSSTFFVVSTSTTFSPLGGTDISILMFYADKDVQPVQATPAVFGSGVDDVASASQILSDASWIVVGSQGVDIYLCNFYDRTPTFTPTIDIVPNGAWPKNFGATGASQTVGNSVQATADGGYIVLGTALRGANYDQYLTKRDANGNMVWEFFLGGLDEKDEGGAVIQTSDGGYAVVGTTEYKSSSMISLIKVTSEGKLQK